MSHAFSVQLGHPQDELSAGPVHTDATAPQGRRPAPYSAQDSLAAESPKGTSM